MPPDVLDLSMSTGTRAAGDTAARVSVSGGAVSLDFDGQQHRAVGSLNAGSEAADMFSIRINGGACTVTMDVRAA